MPKIKINKDHSLPREDLNTRVEDYLVRLRDKEMKMVDFGFIWADDKNSIKLTGKGFKGAVTLTDSNVDIFVDMGILLAPMKGMVEDGLKKGLDSYLK